MKKLIVLSAVVLLIVTGYFLYEEPLEKQYTEVTLPSEGQLLKEKLEQQEEVKKALKEQGYPEELADTLLTEGAQRATSLKNIASVYETYGVPWNLPLKVDKHELVTLYSVGNTASQKFILGQYEDETGESVVYMHMSKNAPIKVLQASLSYAYEQQTPYGTNYMSEKDEILGFYFEVSQGDGTKVKYVATSSKSLTDTVVESFISSIVDGELVKIE